MVKKYIKKRSKPKFPEEDTGKAVKAVMSTEMKLREVAAVFGLNTSTLYYRVQKAIKNQEVGNVELKPQFSSKYKFRYIFSSEEEDMLCNYIVTCSKLNYGLTYKQIRKLAFDFAKNLGRAIPKNSDDQEMAGIDWMKGLMNIHKNLSVRKLGNTNMNCCMASNKENVDEFCVNYQRALTTHSFTSDRILNVDETGVSTVVQSLNVVAATGVKPVGQAASAERGTLITMCAIVSASGNTIPPVFIFPRAGMHDTLMKVAPVGSLGLNNPESGWMISPLFVKVLEHIQKHIHCAKEDPILLLLGNHDSHCKLDTVLFAREHGITMVTFPPHCTHRLYIAS
jgi:hypothetical protein